MDGEVGEVLWLQHYPGLPNNNESVYGIASDADGNAFITGRVHVSDRGDDIVVAKLSSADGEILWMRFLGGLYDDAAWSITVDRSGAPLITGQEANGDGSASFLTAKLFPADGEVDWIRRLPGAVDNIYQPSGWIALMDDGDVVIVNHTWDPSTSYDVVAHRYDAADGATVWERRFGSGPGASDDPRGMVRDHEGNIAVAGGRNGDFMVLDFSGSEGGLRWSSFWDGGASGYDMANSVAVGPAGEIVAAGFCTSETTSWDAAAIGCDPVTGATRWARVFDSGSALADEAKAMAVDARGGIYLVGYGYTPTTDQDILSVRYQTDLPVDVTPADLSLGWKIAPNPFVDRVRIQQEGGAVAFVRARILDPTGRVVGVIRGDPRAGIVWDSRSERGPALPPGVYFLRIDGPDSSEALKLTRSR